MAEGGETAAHRIFIGATRRAGDFLAVAAKPPFDTAVGRRSDGRDVIVRSERRASVERAAGWFLERQLGAHWFMPGPLGEVIPRRGELVVPAGEEVVRPGFVSRDLGGIAGAMPEIAADTAEEQTVIVLDRKVRKRGGLRCLQCDIGKGVGGDDGAGVLRERRCAAEKNESAGEEERNGRGSGTG